MLSTRIKTIACVAAALATAAGAYEHRGAALTSVLLALLSFVFAGLAWRGTGKRKSDALHDPALSTLVFPPESKFQESVFRKG